MPNFDIDITDRLTPIQKPAMNRTLAQWAAVCPDAFLTGSIVQARNVIEMAQQDIAKLGEENERLTYRKGALCDSLRAQAENMCAQLATKDARIVALEKAILSAIDSTTDEAIGEMLDGVLHGQIDTKNWK